VDSTTWPSGRPRNRSVWRAERGAEECVVCHRPSRDGRMSRHEGCAARGALAERADFTRWETEERERAARPASQRGPARRRRRTDLLRRAYAHSDLGSGLTLAGPQCQGPRDGRERVAISATDATRDDEDDCVARSTSVTPTDEIGHGRGFARPPRTFHGPFSKAVTHEHQRAPRLPTRRVAGRAARGSRSRTTRRTGSPQLDVDRRMNNVSLASRLQSAAGHGGERCG